MKIEKNQKERKNVESRLHTFSSVQFKIYHLGDLLWRIRNLCEPQQPAALIYITETNNLSRCSATAAAENPQLKGWSNGKKEQRKEGAALPSVKVGGVYTPNNRCRPEAPLTSLPKLTPVNNEEDRKGGGEEGTNKD